MKKPEIPHDIFAQLDIRAGLIEKVVAVDGSEKLLELTVNLGEDYGTVIVLSGIARWYTPEELTGKKTLFLANLAPRTMMGKMSQGMLVALDTPEHEAKLIYLDPELANGLEVC